MPYSPPVGVVNLNLSGGWTPPVGTANLALVTLGDDLNLTIAARTGGARAALRLTVPNRLAIAARTGGARGIATVAYDPSLLSDMYCVAGDGWESAAAPRPSAVARWEPAAAPRPSAVARWEPAAPMRSGTQPRWAAAERRIAPGAAAWQEGLRCAGATRDGWAQAPRRDQSAEEVWQDGPRRAAAAASRFRVRLPLRSPAWRGVWHGGMPLGIGARARFDDGLLRIEIEIEFWQQADYPGNAPNPGPPLGPIRTPWGTRLRLACPLPGTALRIGRVPCILLAEREIAVQRSYMSFNSASLVRWPDLTPLPVIAMTVETDFESWCWALSATLAGPDAWALVQPNPLACEVQATINGQVWRFLLDVPSVNRSFNSDRVTLKGRSRSAWLHDPYTPSRNFTVTDAREMVQLAEEALANTGWTLDWQLDNWVVPAYHYTSWNTPIGALIRLTAVTDDGLYTHPYLQVITAQKRWPVASWVLDGEAIDLLIPESAVLSLTMSPVYTSPLNGVYVSGVSYGVLALVKIAGTDGAMQPAEPIVNDLLCDAAGVAARARGLNALSDSGAGWEMAAEVLFTPEVGLIKPGMIVAIAGLKGISRSCQIQCNWSGDGLAVRQLIGVERREVEP